MIYVPRDRNPPDLPVFSAKTSKSADGKRKLTRAEKDLEKATAYFGDPEKFADGEKLTRESKPTLEAYSDPQLKARLFELFHNKCAYCEMPLAIGANPDVEHFRPKGRIDIGGRQIEPGYYWLVTDWNNLLLSCQFCNRQQWHLSQGDETLKLGKLDQFPLADEERRVSSPEDPLEPEEAVRLLVQPCVDTNTEEHFRFDREGRIYGVSDKGDTSVIVYALVRKGLVDARKEEMLRLTRQITRVRDAARNLGRARGRQGDAEEIADLDRQLRENLADLELFFVPTSPYLAMKRNYIRCALDNGELADLERAGMKPLELLDVG